MNNACPQPETETENPMNARTTLFAVALSLGASPAWATNFNIQLSGPSATTFTPNSVDVQVGDTVTFINAAGGFHNVASDDPAFPFQCAVNCSTDNGGSNANWTAVLTVPETAAHKDIQFYCQIHGASVMSGMLHITNPVDLQSFDID
jgi:plastocyanin